MRRNRSTTVSIGLEAWFRARVRRRSTTLDVSGFCKTKMPRSAAARDHVISQDQLEVVVVKVLQRLGASRRRDYR